MDLYLQAVILSVIIVMIAYFLGFRTVRMVKPLALIIFGI
jgi:hypothetical protein